MSTASINILMTGGGAPGAPGILRCLQMEPTFNITVADANPHAVGRYLHDDFETIPFAHEESFIEKLLLLCQQKNIHVIMPLVTKELLLFAWHKKEFDKIGVKVLVSQHSSLEIANNKSRLYEFLEWRGLPVPTFKVANNINEFTEAVAALGYPEKTICFKPSVANGSRGFRILAKNINELDLLFNQKPNSTFISINDAVRILSSGQFPELLISAYLPGDEYSVDCLANNGEALLVVPRKRSVMINGISVAGKFVRDENIIHSCVRIIQELKLHGNIGIQVKGATDGAFLALEINPRVQGTIVAGLGAGINLPALAVKQEMGLTILPEELNVKWGTNFIRYWSEVYY